MPSPTFRVTTLHEQVKVATRRLDGWPIPQRCLSGIRNSVQQSEALKVDAYSEADSRAASPPVSQNYCDQQTDRKAASLEEILKEKGECGVSHLCFILLPSPHLYPAEEKMVRLLCSHTKL